MRAEQKTIEQITAAADEGDAEAQYRLGQALIRGTGVKRDLRKAHEYLQNAADQGHPEPSAGWVTFHANGYIVKKDLAAAAEWFRKGAEKGGAAVAAQLRARTAPWPRRGGGRSHGLKWIEKARRSEPARCVVRDMANFSTTGNSATGRTTRRRASISSGKQPKPTTRPRKTWWARSIGTALGVPADLAKAEHWFRKSAEQGDPNGMSNLGQLLGPDGPDASKHVEAMKWLLLARRANEPQAVKILNEILRTRPPEIVKEAQRQMNEFKPRASLEGNEAAAPADN